MNILESFEVFFLNFEVFRKLFVHEKRVVINLAVFSKGIQGRRHAMRGESVKRFVTTEQTFAEVDG